MENLTHIFHRDDRPIANKKAAYVILKNLLEES